MHHQQNVKKKGGKIFVLEKCLFLVVPCKTISNNFYGRHLPFVFADLSLTNFSFFF